MRKETAHILRTTPGFGPKNVETLPYPEMEVSACVLFSGECPLCLRILRKWQNTVTVVLKEGLLSSKLQFSHRLCGHFCSRLGQLRSLIFPISFYARQHNAIARICHGNSVYLSVRPSVTRVDQSKTVEARITQFSPYSSPIPLVFRG